MRHLDDAIRRSADKATYVRLRTLASNAVVAGDAARQGREGRSAIQDALRPTPGRATPPTSTLRDRRPAAYAGLLRALMAGG